MQNTLPIDGVGGGDPLALTILLWAIRIILPLAAAALWLKFSSPDGKTTSSTSSTSLSSRTKSFFSSMWPSTSPSYTVTEILRYRLNGKISRERPPYITTLAPQERRHLGRRTDESEIHIHASPPSGGLLSAPRGGERDGPRPGSFRNGARASLRREVQSPQADAWLPTADASQLGVSSQSSLMPPTTDNIHGGPGMQMHQGGLISAAAYQKMKTSRRSDDAAQHYTKSPTLSYPVSPTPLSLTHALSAAFTNTSLTPLCPEGTATTHQMSALRSLTPQIPQTRATLFESPALPTSLHRPQTAIASANSVAQSHENTTHHVNTPSHPVAADSSSSPPSFITANRDAVIELRKLLSAPSVVEATRVLERLRSQGMAIAPQTYTLLVTVAILCGCKNFALVCAKDMAEAGYVLSDALQSKLQNMEASKHRAAVSMSTAVRAPDTMGAHGDPSTTKLMANAPVFTPSAIGAISNGPWGELSATTTGSRNVVSASSTNPSAYNGPSTAPTWLLPTQHSNGNAHGYSNTTGPHHMIGGGARVVPLMSKQQHQQGPLAWLPPQHMRSQQTARDGSPPMPDSSPPGSDMLPHRRPIGTSAPSSPHDKTSAIPQRSSPAARDGGAVHFHKAVSQLNGAGAKKGGRRTPEGVGAADTKRPRSSWRKKSEATEVTSAAMKQRVAD